MTQTTPALTLAPAKDLLAQAGQEHLLKFYPQLSPDQQRDLLDQIASVDWAELARLIQTHVLRKPDVHIPDHLEPAPFYPNIPPQDLAAKYDQARQLGIDLIRQGKVAAFTVAGGQGTRLGWNAPKGTFPATPIRKMPLFGCFAEYIRRVQDKYDTTVPWYIMTSPVNDAATRQFLEQQHHYGLDPANVMIFPQAMMPAVDMTTGKVLLESPASIALSPNGHGGSLKALFAGGAIADMQQRGVEHISYIQVDNPMVRVVDPQFIGLHALDHAQMSSKMLPKAFPKEKLGNFCLDHGRMTVIEYSDLPDELAEQRLPNGQLRFLAGSIAIHAIRVDFVQWLNTRPGGFGLTFHRAEKKVPSIDTATGRPVQPDALNAVKLETFVFDALPMCDRSIIYETSRPDEFGPIKNADGHDSPATSRQFQIERAARWLEAQGVKVPRLPDKSVDAVIEISNLTAIEPDDLDDVDLPEAIGRGREVLL
ncbi:MAG: UTP--glucose-1-phosphate uridylyltransferase [Phycisphaeraceae bacterium]|nr:UTP--glucose-1-phosphate uridylyltransferase [Phycisphaeraceae bacterium]